MNDYSALPRPVPTSEAKDDSSMSLGGGTHNAPREWLEARVLTLEAENAQLRAEKADIAQIHRDLLLLFGATVKASETDYLTNLYNRRGSHRVLRGMVDHAQRNNSPVLGFITLDIDHFKRINDTYGHEAGDKALQHVATILARNARSYDLVARNGGEEFLIAIQTDSLMTLQYKAERIRSEIQNTPCPIGNDQVINFTASFGVTLWNTTSERTLQQALHIADEAMYEAKNTGRNKVCMSLEKREPTAPTSLIPQAQLDQFNLKG